VLRLNTKPIGNTHEFKLRNGFYSVITFLIIGIEVNVK